MVQWLRLSAFSASTAGAVGLLPGQGTKIPHALQGLNQKKKKIILRGLSNLRPLKFR